MPPYALKKTPKILLLALTILTFWAQGTAFSQDVPKDIISRIKKLQRLKPGPEAAAPTLEDIQLIEKDISEAHPALDKDTETILNTLKNPFESKLPKPRKATGEEDLSEKQPLGPQTPSPLPDGTTPPPVEPDYSRYNISGLVWDTDLPQAILNDRVVGVGEIIDGWTITGITQEGIEFSMQENSYLIKPKGVKNATPSSD